MGSNRRLRPPKSPFGSLKFGKGLNGRRSSCLVGSSSATTRSRSGRSTSSMRRTHSGALPHGHRSVYEQGLWVRRVRIWRFWEKVRSQKDVAKGHVEGADLNQTPPVSRISEGGGAQASPHASRKSLILLPLMLFGGGGGI